MVFPAPYLAPRSPRRRGARGPTSPGQCPPPLAPQGSPRNPGLQRPGSHETRAGTVRARVVPRAVTLWRLSPPRGARGVPSPPPPTRLGVCRECTPDPVAAGSLGTVRALGCLREATRCPVGLCGPAVRLAEAWLLLQSVAGAFPYGGVIEYSLGPKG